MRLGTAADRSADDGLLLRRVLVAQDFGAGHVLCRNPASTGLSARRTQRACFSFRAARTEVRLVEKRKVTILNKQSVCSIDYSVNTDSNLTIFVRA